MKAIDGCCTGVARGAIVASGLVIALALPLSPSTAKGDESDDGKPSAPDGPPQDVDQGAAAGFDSLDDVDLFEMEVPVVVTAARRAQKLATVPYAMSVITAEDIRQSGARTIPDALRLVPGVDVADLSYGNAAVSPRGFHGFIAAQVLVLVDGRQIFDSLFGGTLWGSWPFHLEDIERIEVIRGPGGVTWGANAMNGIINIITKDPANQQGTTVVARAASRGVADRYIGYGTRNEKLRWRLSFEYESSDGFAKGGSFLRNLEDDYLGASGALHAIYDVGPDETLTLSAGSAVVDGGFPPTPLGGLFQTRNPGSRASYLLGTWHRTTRENDELELTGFVNEFHASPGLKQIDYRYQQIGLLFSQTRRYDENRIVTWGVDTRTDLVQSSGADPFMLSKGTVDTAFVGLYLQQEWQFAPKWTLSLGGRIDYEFYGGFQPSARAAVSYELSDNAMVYGAVSRAFHTPVAAARFLDIPLLNGIAHVTAERGVDPTTLIAYELGYRGTWFGKVNTAANLFWHDYDEVATLSPRLGPPGLIRFDLGNRGGAALYGFEFEAKYSVSKKLTLLANYTYQQMNWYPSEPYTERDYITPPKHKAMVGARYAVNERLHLSSHLYYVDAVGAPDPHNPFFPRYIPPYLRLDVRGEYTFKDERTSLAVGGRNLLDGQHYEGRTSFLNDAEVPRMLFAELRVALP